MQPANSLIQLDIRSDIPLLVPDKSCLEKLSDLISRFHLETTESVEGPHLLFEGDRLRLILREQQKIRFSFLDEQLQFRRRGQRFNEGLAKAFTIKGQLASTIIDLTAGAGIDSFLLADWGAKVRMYERNNIIAALLSDALEELYSHEEKFIEQLQLCFEDSEEALSDEQEIQPDAAYLDPMFPEKNKKALVKKNIAGIQSLAKADYEPVRLLELARRAVSQRVVVKRPKSAAFLGDQTPNFQIPMKKHRYDIYLPTNN